MKRQITKQEIKEMKANNPNWSISFQSYVYGYENLTIENDFAFIDGYENDGLIWHLDELTGAA